MPPRGTHLEIAFARMEPRIRAVPKSQFRTINLDIPVLVTTTYGVVPKVKALAEGFAKYRFDMSLVDDLLDYALALGHCHLRWRIAVEPPKTFRDLAQRVRQHRRRLHRLAIALVTDGLLDAERVETLKSGNGYNRLAFDTVGLFYLFRDAWHRIEGKTSVTQAELLQVGRDAEQLIRELGDDHAKERARVVAETTLLRRQAYALFLRTYAEVRQHVQFVRREQRDADAIMPSLFAERGLKSGATKRRKAAGNEPAPPTPVVAAHLVGPGGSPTPAARQLPERTLDRISVPWPGLPGKGDE
jgi:hypothetical protein